jgi:hypothetical protein
MGAIEPPNEDIGVASSVCAKCSFVGIGTRLDIIVEALEDVLDDLPDYLVKRESDPTLMDNS